MANHAAPLAQRGRMQGAAKVSAVEFIQASGIKAGERLGERNG